MSEFTTKLSIQQTNITNPTSDDPEYLITAPLIYNFGSNDVPLATFTVPEGFMTDLASIPWPVSLFLKPDGKYASAAVLHDWITGDTNISELAQDAIFYDAMKASGVHEIVCWIFFTCVRIYRFFHDSWGVQ